MKCLRGSVLSLLPPGSLGICRCVAVLDYLKAEPCFRRARGEDRPKPVGSALSSLPSIWMRHCKPALMENQDLTFLMHEDKANEISKGAWSTGARLRGRHFARHHTPWPTQAGRLPAAWAHSPWHLL